MVGANYMGGKRNAVKSKLRDATSRAQQGFFGRRRFELLSKGLAPTNQPGTNTDANGSNKRLEISLAHARNKHPQRPINTYVRTPSPLHAEPTRDPDNPCSKKRSKADGHVHLTSEISPRSLRERALSLRDLAGLKRGDATPRRSCNTKVAESPQGMKSAKSARSSFARQSTPSLSFNMSPDASSAQSKKWKSLSSRVDQPVFRESSSDNIGLPFSASSLSPLLSDFSSSDRIEKRIQDGENSPLRYVSSNLNISMHGTDEIMLSSCSSIAFPEDQEEIPNISAESGDFDLEGLSDSLGQFESDTEMKRGEEFLLSYSDLGSPFRFTSPPDYHVSGASSPNSELLDGNRRFLLLERYHSRSSTNDTSPFTWLQTSRAFSTPSPRYGRDQSPNGSPAWLRGCIFDYEDPWDAIGVIMGLSPNNPNKLTLEEELATFGAAEFGCATAASDDAGCNGALEDYSDERTSYTMFSPARSSVDTTQKRSGSSCISHCNDAWKAHSGDGCRSSEPTDLVDVSTGYLINETFVTHEHTDCFDEPDLGSALTWYGTGSPSCTKSPVIAPSPHWPLSPAHTISMFDNHIPPLSYDRQLECSANEGSVAEEKPEPDSVTIVPSPDRPSLVDTRSFSRHQLPLVGDDGGQVESHSDNNVGMERSLMLAYPFSSPQPADDLNSYTINGGFRGLRLFRDDSDTEST